MAEEDMTEDASPDEDAGPKSEFDTDWLTKDSRQSSARARDHHRRGRVQKAPSADSEAGEELDIDVDELDAFQDQMGDLSDEAFAEAQEKTEEVGVSIGNGDGRILVTIDEGGGAASLKLLDLGGDKSLKVKDVQQVMEKKFDVRFGVDEEALGKLVAMARKGKRIEGSHIVAKDGEVRCLFLIGEPPEVQPAYQELQPAFGKETVEEALEHCPLASLVAAGDRIVELVPPTDGQPGTSVFGERQVEPGDAVEVKLGSNVSESETAGTYCADMIG